MKDDKQLALNPGVRMKDSVYFQHPEKGPTHGVVAAVGAHGFTADSEEHGECQVPWGDFIGHRKRATRSVKVVDQGEDGMLLEEEDGSRSYFHGSLADLGSGDSLAKALPGVALALDQQFEYLSLPEKARIISDLAGAGFCVSEDYVRAIFGGQFSAQPEGRSFFGLGACKNG